MKKSVVIRYTKFLFALLILSVCLRWYFFTRKLNFYRAHTGEKVTIDFWVTNLPANCKFATREGLNFVVFGCEKLEIGEIYTIVGSVREQSANFTFDQIYMDVEEINKISFATSSFKFKLLSVGQKILRTQAKIATLIDETLHTYFTGDAYYLVAGLSLGSRFVQFSREFKSLIASLGLSHMVAVSGFHLNIVFTLVSGIFLTFCPRRIGVPLVILVLAWYTMLVSSPWSILRALFMLIFSLIGRLIFFKSINSFHSLFTSWLLFAIFDPTVASNVGVQLSYLATWGILAWGSCTDEVLTPDVTELALGASQIKLGWESLWAAVKSSVMVTMAAQVMTLPVIINSFGEWAPWGFLSSLVFATAVTVVVLAIIPLLCASGVAFYVLPWLQWLLEPIYGILSDFVSIFLWCLRMFAQIFGGTIQVNFRFNFGLCCGYYLGLYLAYSIVHKFLSKRVTYV